MNHVHLLNSNVYLSNFLLIPTIIFNILIIRSIKKWNEKEFPKKKQYLLFWYIVLGVLLVGIFFSNIHHIFMFTEKKLLIKIGKIDSVLSAPLIGVFVIIMNVFYIKYLRSKCASKDPIKKLTSPIYTISLIYSFIGVFSFIFKKILVRDKLTELWKYKYITFHIFFHYTTYVGILLLFLMYYLEKKELYNFVFNKSNCRTNKSR